MPPQIALFVFLAYILWLFVKDVKRRIGLSRSLWIVAAWLIIIGSRPVSSWFNFGGSVGGTAEAYDSGNPFERQVYLLLIVAGLITLARRGVSLWEVIHNNRWVFVFYLFWGASVLWSDAPVVALKRWIKDMGNVVMVLLVLTENDPVEAAKAAFARCCYLLIPLSVLFIKCFSELGRAYHVWSGEMMYTGVATHKNSLGSLVLVCGLVFLWDFTDRFREESGRRDRLGLLSDLSLMGMTLWLLIEAHSATALSCTVIGVAIFFVLGLSWIKSRVKHIEIYAITIGFSLWLLNTLVDIPGLVLGILGRDRTLTTRTEVWPMLIGQSDSLLFGSGFCSFWSGDRLEQIYSKLGIIQAHNGYLETYLNGGLIAVVLLIIVLFSASRNIKKGLVAGDELAKVKLMFLVIAIVYDFTEAAFNKMGLIWLACLLAVIQYPRAQAGRLAASPSRLPADAHEPRSPDLACTHPA